MSFGSGVNNISSINSVHVYPNPTSGQLFVDVTLKDASDLNVSIFSVTGALVYNGKFNHILAQVINIPTYNLASGVYTLQVTAPGETKTNKVVVQH
ncbi:MAG: T9SS type A sorting domain-containing protein [Bacteroidetes bacterium]|nr:T9SS type A sorting domain-containing protein [Bacteroidota bacterium]